MTYTQVKEAIQDIGKDEVRILIDNLGEEVVKAGLEAGIGLSTLEEAYQGECDSDEEFVQELIESCGDVPKDLPNYIYIDWVRTARDVMMDYTEQNRYYFRNI